MKKYFISYFLFLLCTLCCWSQTVSESDARTIAQNFFVKSSADSSPARANALRKDLRLVHKSLKAENGDEAYYYIYQSQGDGFVIISGDERLSPVVGYGDASVTGEMPENFKTWMKQYEAVIDGLDSGAQSAPQRARSHVSVSNQVAVPPLLGTGADANTWGQGDSENPTYNYYCPVLTADNSKHAIVGCVATSMVQIMKYHEYPQHTMTSLPAYSNSTFTSNCNIYSAEYEWDKMLLNYDGEYTQENVEAVALLMYHCGLAVGMNYGLSASSANSSVMADAFINYFGYSDSTRYVTRNDYSYEDWISLIYNELINRRPIAYIGCAHSNAAHAFVCDGSDGEGYFHFNWGWNGLFNGFFDIDVMNPSNTVNEGYSFGQEMIIGIKAPLENELSPAHQLSIRDAYTGTSQSKDTCSYNKANDIFALDFYAYIESTNFVDTALPLRLVILNEEGNTVSAYDLSFTFANDRPYTILALSINEGNLLAGSAYNVYLCSKDAEGEWQVMNNGYERCWGIEVSGTGTQARVYVHDGKLVAKNVTVDDIGYVDYGCTIMANIKNEGDVRYMDDIYLYSSTTNDLSLATSYASVQYLYLDSNDSVDISLSFTPSEGTNYLWITNQKKEVLATTQMVSTSVTKSVLGTDLIFDSICANLSSDTLLVSYIFGTLNNEDDDSIYLKAAYNSINFSLYFTNSGGYIKDTLCLVLYSTDTNTEATEKYAVIEMDGAGTKKIDISFDDLAAGGYFANVYVDGAQFRQTKKFTYYNKGITKYYPGFTSFMFHISSGATVWNTDGTKQNSRLGVTGDYVAIDLVNNYSSSASLVTSSNNNCVYYLPADVVVPASLEGKNVAIGGVMDLLQLTESSSFNCPRSFVANSAQFTASSSKTYGTIILPYPPKQEASITYYTLSDVQSEYLSFVEVTTPQANTPYLYKYVKGDAGANTPTFSSQSSVIIPVTTGSLTGNTQDDFVMKGTFATQLLSGDSADYYFYFLSNGTIYYQGEGMLTIKPFRCWWETPKNTSSLIRSFEIREDINTSMEEVIDEMPMILFAHSGCLTVKCNRTMPVTIYSLNGTRVADCLIQEGCEQSFNLPSGTYVVNDVKIRIK